MQGYPANHTVDAALDTDRLYGNYIQHKQRI